MDVGGRGGVQGGETEGSSLGSAGRYQSFGHSYRDARGAGKVAREGRGTHKKHLSDLSSSHLPLFIC